MSPLLPATTQSPAGHRHSAAPLWSPPGDRPDPSAQAGERVVRRGGHIIGQERDRIAAELDCSRHLVQSRLSAAGLRGPR